MADIINFPGLSRQPITDPQVLGLSARYYTGVGARITPPNILRLMEAIARKMHAYGYILRSGGAKGADSAFELGAGQQKDIFRAYHANQASEAIASSFWKSEFPVPWHKLKPFTKKLHSRNAFQVLGADLVHPSEYCICWTPDACASHATRTVDTGGTGTAISIASMNGVPVVNLADPHWHKVWSDWAMAA